MTQDDMIPWCPKSGNSGKESVHFIGYSLEYYSIGQVANLINYGGTNDINMTLTDDAVWYVDGTSLITSLTIEDDAQVIVLDGATLTVGSTTYEAGTVLTSGDTEEDDTDGDDTDNDDTDGSDDTGNGDSDGDDTNSDDTDDSDTDSGDTEGDDIDDGDDTDDGDTDSDNPTDGDEDFDFTEIPEDGMGSGSDGSTDDEDTGDGEDTGDDTDSGDTGDDDTDSDDTEDKETVYEAAVLGENTVYVYGDTVYLSYTPDETSDYVIYSTGSDDTYGYLLDASFELLKSNDDVSDDDLNFSISYTLEAGTTYYIGVRYYDSGDEGEITFYIELYSDGDDSDSDETGGDTDAGSEYVIEGLSDITIELGDTYQLSPSITVVAASDDAGDTTITVSSNAAVALSTDFDAYQQYLCDFLEVFEAYCSDIIDEYGSLEALEEAVWALSEDTYAEDALYIYLTSNSGLGRDSGLIYAYDYETFALQGYNYVYINKYDADADVVEDDETGTEDDTAGGTEEQDDSSAGEESTETSDAYFAYESADPSIASVSDTGLVTGVAEGETTVTVSCIVDGEAAASETITVTVTAAAEDDDTDSDDTDDDTDSSDSPEIIEDETNSTYSPDEDTETVIAVDADIDTFISVVVDGVELTQYVDYIVTEGSTIITFTESFLETLSEGEHDVVIAFTSGEVETNLRPLIRHEMRRARSGEVDKIGIASRLLRSKVENTDDGTNDDGTADDGTTDDGTTDDGTTDNGTTDDGTTDDGTAGNGTTDNGTNDDGTSDNGTTGDDMTGSGDTDDSSGETGNAEGTEDTEGTDDAAGTEDAEDTIDSGVSEVTEEAYYSYLEEFITANYATIIAEYPEYASLSAEEIIEILYGEDADAVDTLIEALVQLSAATYEEYAADPESVSLEASTEASQEDAEDAEDTDAGDSEESDDSDESSTADVGDSSNLVLWMVLGLLAAIAIACESLRRRITG